jgi:hypothetical protein
MIITIALAMAAAAQGTVVIPGQALEQPAKAEKPQASDDDTPEEIAKDAARDLKDSRFYNKPGATRAQYDADWQECRLIARGSRTPSGTVVVPYNPAIISPVAAGAAAGIGGLIGGAIVQGQVRRANRRSCLLVRGWRLVEVDGAEQERVNAMTDEERSRYFDTIVGAEDVKGKKVISWTNDFAAPQLAPESEQ